ncbi:collagenase [Wansuia hejianensis]|uniref:Collagenase n=1 Tax=Wansuia hejianensis TaxID=2763667 RepID=A0A926F4B5_9FIRM|nr:collagenase [Wansuia hejianensis]MBC8591634.1 collagenase [Wansuia hejianensis]
MKILKQLILSILIIILSTVMIFVLYLFLNTNLSIRVLGISILILLAMVIYGIDKIIKGKSKVEIFQGRSGGVFIIIIALIIGFNSFIMVTANYMVDEIYSESLIATERIEVYKTLIGVLKAFINEDNITIAKFTNTRVSDFAKEEQNVEEIGYIKLYYNDSHNKEFIQAVKDSIKIGEKETEDIFGHVDKKELNIFFDDIQVYLESYLGDKVSELEKGLDIDRHGVYDSAGSIYLNLPKASKKEYVREVFIHEYSHYIFDLYLSQNQIMHKNIPTWFNEGIAEYICLYDRGWEFHPDILPNIVEFRKMDVHQEWNDLLNNSGEHLYYQSYFAISALIDMKGKDVIQKIILKSRNMDFYDGFAEVVGMNIEKFQDVFFEKHMEDYHKRTSEN